MTTPMFTGMHTVAVPVTDQERTKALFERFGLQTRLDTELQPGFRWIEMALQDTPTSLALVRTGPELPAGIDTGIRLTTADARFSRQRDGAWPRRRRALGLADRSAHVLVHRLRRESLLRVRSDVR